MEEIIWQDLPQLLTAREAAYLLRVHVNTIYNWIHNGRLPAFKIGRSWRVRKSAVWMVYQNA